MHGRSYHPDQPEIFEHTWRFDLEKGLIAIGWQLAGDVSKLSLAAMSDRLLEFYPDGPGAANMLWHFYNSVDVGDEIVALRGRRLVIGLGTVTRGAFYDKQLGQERVGRPTPHFKPHFIGVDWHTRHSITFEGEAFGRRTLSRIRPEKYSELMRQIR